MFPTHSSPNVRQTARRTCPQIVVMDGPRRALWRVLIGDLKVDPGSEAGMTPSGRQKNSPRGQLIVIQGGSHDF